jgi:simple sugar transport system permease protein
MEAFLSLAFLVQVLRISVPYVLASLGGTFSERGGTVNIALEGIMLTGAFGFVLGTYGTGSVAVGLLAGAGAGVAVAALLALATIRFGADQIVCGVAINLLAVGCTRFGLKMVWDSSSNSSRVETLGAILEPEGTLGIVLGVLTHPLVLLAAALVVAGHVLLFHTRFGLRLRACGEHPHAAASLGVSVRRMRWYGVLLSGLLAGLAGVWLAVDQHQFTDNMTNGRGYIALAAMIVGRWRPGLAALACLLFGAAEAVQITLAGQGIAIPTQFLQMLPYLLTIVAVVGFMGRSTPPAAVGKPYED